MYYKNIREPLEFLAAHINNKPRN